MGKATDEEVKLAANTLRCLCADMVDRANSGHPGAPLGMADMAATLWLRFLEADPADPAWPGRDRVVFSGGHASSLVYALANLASGNGALGNGPTLDELKEFRQWGARCAGHPERGAIPGVEVTTGPLGQGVAMGVGLALAAKKAASSNKTWVFCGDGDMEEGVSHEACSLAGALKLDGLVLVYDSNGITIEGSTAIAMADDTKKRFEAYGWKVYTCDGHDIAALTAAFRRASKTAGAPALVIARTHIGCGAPTKHDSAGVHGSPLGAEETRGLKTALGFDPDKSFFVPEGVYGMFAERAALMRRLSKRWRREAQKAGGKTAKTADYLDLVKALPQYESGSKAATRNVCGEVLNALAPLCPGLTGGSADLAPSNKTYLKGMGDVAPGDFSGRNIHYGVRELAMAAIANGLTAYGGLRGYGATFFVFSDYIKPALRLAALMKLPSMFFLSHDSFYVGEDGPTHEPVEQLASLRSMPGVVTFRPADPRETAYAIIEMLLCEDRPTCLLTTRQNVPVLDGVRHEGVAKGGYCLYESGPQDSKTILFIATGSEVSLALEAAKTLAGEGRGVRVVSMPSMELFLAQNAGWRESATPSFMKRRVIVEAGARFGWDRFAADPATTRYVTMDRYGASAPCEVLAEKFGFTVENVLAAARAAAGVEGFAAGGNAK